MNLENLRMRLAVLQALIDQCLDVEPQPVQHLIGLAHRRSDCLKEIATLTLGHIFTNPQPQWPAIAPRLVLTSPNTKTSPRVPQ